MPPRVRMSFNLVRCGCVCHLCVVTFNLVYTVLQELLRSFCVEFRCSRVALGRSVRYHKSSVCRFGRFGSVSQKLSVHVLRS